MKKEMPLFYYEIIRNEILIIYCDFKKFQEFKNEILKYIGSHYNIEGLIVECWGVNIDEFNNTRKL